MDELKVVWIAEIAHEVNRAYCESIGDHSQVSWGDAEDWQKDSAIDGVRRMLNNPRLSAEQMHEAWVEFKKADGWIYGAIKDPVAKTHPCMVPYSDLSVPQRVKDYMFSSVVRALDRMWVD